MKKTQVSLLLTSLVLGSAPVSAAKFGLSPIPRDDYASIIMGVSTEAKGNVTVNDSYGISVSLDGSAAGQYGYLNIAPSGEYTYTLYKGVNSSTLPASGLVKDVFIYSFIDIAGNSSNAKLTIETKIIKVPKPIVNNDVDIEFNDRSWEATPLNSGRNILGHLHSAGDKDWFALASSGNETVSLELCPEGSSCAGKNSWVMYVFDSSKITAAMETKRYGFSRWVDETGGGHDLAGRQIIETSAGSSNHMYLAYRAGAFNGALIGVVDPCFGETNTVDIGVGRGSKNYLVAISSPLRGSGDEIGEKGVNSCGAGSVVLQKPSLSASGLDDKGKVKSFTTTEEYVSVFPYRDDQYSIKVTGTGINPLLTTEAKSKSATFSGGNLSIPKLMLSGYLFGAQLTQSNSMARSFDSSLRFKVSTISSLNAGVTPDIFQATYNENSLLATIPRVTDTETGTAYSVVLQYHRSTTGKDDWLTVNKATVIE